MVLNLDNDQEKESFFLKKTKKLSIIELDYFNSIILEYQALSLKYKTVPTYTNAFLQRFDTIISKNKKNIDIFLKAELEAIDLFKKKVENFKNQETNDLVIEKIQKSLIPNIDLNKYPRIFIHAKAGKNIESLYGAFVNFKKKFLEGLLYSSKIIVANEYEKIIYSVRYMIEDFTHSKNHALPLFFEQYSFELDQGNIDEEDLELEIINKAKIFFKKIDKIIHWGNHKIKKDDLESSFTRIPLLDQRVEFNDFFDALKEDASDMINDFDLES